MCHGSTSRMVPLLMLPIPPRGPIYRLIGDICARCDYRTHNGSIRINGEYSPYCRPYVCMVKRDSHVYKIHHKTIDTNISDYFRSSVGDTMLNEITSCFTRREWNRDHQIVLLDFLLDHLMCVKIMPFFTDSIGKEIPVHHMLFSRSPL